MSFRLLIAAALLLPCLGIAGEGEAADLRMRIASTDLLRYAWTIHSASDSTGRERGRAFKLTSDSTCGMNLTLRGMPKVKDGMTVAMKISDLNYADKRRIGADKEPAAGADPKKDSSSTDLFLSRTRVKYSENGVVKVDSDNDIGLDKLSGYQEHIRTMESGELRMIMDEFGHQLDLQGDPGLLDTIRNGGATGIFPILAGRSVKPGESWEESFSMPKMGDFKLAKPAVIKAKMTFLKWEKKGQRNVAQIEISTAWEQRDLKGENESGMLVEISRVDGRGSGTCLFDPAQGKFIEGNVTTSVSYRIDGEFEGQTTGLEVTGKTRFSFTSRD